MVREMPKADKEGRAEVEAGYMGAPERNGGGGVERWLARDVREGAGDGERVSRRVRMLGRRVESMLGRRDEIACSRSWAWELYSKVNAVGDAGSWLATL